MNDRLFTLPKKLAERHHTRDPFVLADLLGFSVRFLDTKVQKGFCANILNNYFIFINRNLSPEMQRLNRAHELGHVRLHKDRLGRDEVDDETLLELLRSGQDIVAAARALGVNVNLLAIKLAEMKKAGLPLNDLPLSPDRTFLGRIADSAGSL